MIIRKPNLEDLTEEGIPRDFSQVMEYFNTALTSSEYDFIPRKTPITINEIIETWLPNSDKTLSLMAEEEGQVVGSLVVFFERPFTSYEHAEEMLVGEISATHNTNFDEIEIKSQLFTEAHNQLLELERTGILHTTNPRIIERFNLMGWPSKRVNYNKERKIGGYRGEAMRYTLGK